MAGLIYSTGIMFFHCFFLYKYKESLLSEPSFDFTPDGWRLPLDTDWDSGMVAPARRVYSS